MPEDHSTTARATDTTAATDTVLHLDIRIGNQAMPSFLVQAGHAPQPCSACTFSATAICSSRLA
ncbi:hypothetical protein FRP1_30455 (plasmid) [Pseudonocardia sp. EC080625-04]|nr:hypothetical protein FRP1_30455 [Pseudonocardia sp. EC080625-04]